VEIDQQMVGVGVREMKKYANFHKENRMTLEDMREITDEAY